jgi:hypothetical protein
MARIAVTELAPGMLLAGELLDEEGRCLLAAGTTLTEKSIALLARRGVEHVVVREDTSALDPAERERRRAELVARIDKRFRYTQGHALMDALRESVIAFRLRESGLDR